MKTTRASKKKKKNDVFVYLFSEWAKIKVNFRIRLHV